MKILKSAFFLFIFSIAALYAQQPPEPTPGGPRNDLNLNDSQKEKIEKILESSRNKMDKVRERTMKVMETLRDSTELISKETDKEILKVLSKEQAEKFKSHSEGREQLAMMPPPAMMIGNLPCPDQQMQCPGRVRFNNPGTCPQNNQAPCIPGQNFQGPDNMNENSPEPDFQKPGAPNDDELDSLIDMDLLDLLSIIE